METNDLNEEFQTAEEIPTRGMARQMFANAPEHLQYRTETKYFYECKRCEKEWEPRNIARIPTQCPYCHSPYWNRERRNLSDGLAKPAAPVYKYGWDQIEVGAEKVFPWYLHGLGLDEAKNVGRLRSFEQYKRRHPNTKWELTPKGDGLHVRRLA